MDKRKLLLITQVLSQKNTRLAVFLIKKLNLI